MHWLKHHYCSLQIQRWCCCPFSSYCSTFLAHEQRAHGNARAHARAYTRLRPHARAAALLHARPTIANQSACAHSRTRVRLRTLTRERSRTRRTDGSKRTHARISMLARVCTRAPIRALAHALTRALTRTHARCHDDAGDRARTQADERGPTPAGTDAHGRDADVRAIAEIKRLRAMPAPNSKAWTERRSAHARLFVYKHAIAAGYNNYYIRRHACPSEYMF